MNLILITRILAAIGLGFAVIGILLRIDDILRRPFKQDLSRERGDTRRGILYAFTLGMAPWEKESTRIHWLAYLRGILFHVSIFAAFAVLFASPWLDAIPSWLKIATAVFLGLGAASGFAGTWMRYSEGNLKAISTPDDYLAVFLTALFIALASATLVASGLLPAFYIISAVLLVYIPISKIRHCVYFFYSKFFFGKSFGYRAVIGQAQGEYHGSE